MRHLTAALLLAASAEPQPPAAPDRVRGKDGTWRTFGRSVLSRTLPPR